jgi:hypothetical protein
VDRARFVAQEFRADRAGDNPLMGSEQGAGPLWTERVVTAARIAVERLDAADSLHHANMIEDLLALIARLDAEPLPRTANGAQA